MMARVVAERERAVAERKLKLRARAARMDETRERIARAALELHATVGPARTTISAVAERAGVQRHTVYQHFPDELSLAAACTAYGLAQDPQPDPETLGAIAGPEARLRRALEQQYGYYRRNESLLANALRDAPVMEQRLGAAGLDWTAVPRVVRDFFSQPARLRQTLDAGWNDGTTSRPHVAATLALVVDFWSWRTVTREAGMTDAEAVDLAVRLVTCAAREEQSEHHVRPERRSDEPPGADGGQR